MVLCLLALQTTLSMSFYEIMSSEVHFCSLFDIISMKWYIIVVFITDRRFWQ